MPRVISPGCSGASGPAPASAFFSSTSDARDAVLGWADSFGVADSTWPAFQSALDLQAREHVSFWDALILSVAAESRCRWVLSEDLHAGLTWRGVTVVDPFAGRLPFEPP
jgi:predicted nucleic acid-binding protein